MSPNAAIAWMRRRWWVLAVLVAFVVVLVWTATGAINDSNERRASRARIEASASEAKTLAQQVRDQNLRIAAQAEDIKRALALIESATSAEAQARGAAATARAVADLRRSIDCVALYVNDERPPTCEEVARRMDRIRNGEDPFDFSTPTTNPSPTTTPPGANT